MARTFARLPWSFVTVLALCGCGLQPRPGQSSTPVPAPGAAAPASVELPPPFQDPGAWDRDPEDDQERSVDPAANAIYVIRRFYGRPRGPWEEWEAAARHINGKEAGRWLYVHWTGGSGDRRPIQVFCVHSHDSQGRAVDVHELKDDGGNPWADAAPYTRKLSRKQTSDPDIPEAAWSVTVGYYEQERNELVWVGRGFFNATEQPIGEWEYSSLLRGATVTYGSPGTVSNSEARPVDPVERIGMVEWEVQNGRIRWED